MRLDGDWFADEGLARRLLEHRRAMARSWSEVARRHRPELDPTWWESGTAFATFTGDRCPLSQAFGVGFADAAPDEDLDGLFAFYHGRCSAFELVTSPYCSTGTWNSLLARGARVQAFESVLAAKPIPEVAAPSIAGLGITEVGYDLGHVWADTSLRGFFGPELTPEIRFLGRLLGEGSHVRRYLALVAGEPAGAAATVIHNGVAYFGGAAVLPDYRNRGVQAALIARRLTDAKAIADMVTLDAQPGSSSHRNAERMGFRVAYTATSLTVPCADA